MSLENARHLETILLAASVLPLLLGPPLAKAAGRSHAASVFLDAFVTVSVVAMTVLWILPEASEIIGPLSTLVAASIGMAIPWGLHRWWHHRPRMGRAAVFLLAFSGLTLHGILDGVALFAPTTESHGSSEAASTVLAAAVLLHRLPMALAIWWLARPQVGRILAGGLLAALGAATGLGFLVGGPLWSGLHSTASMATQAFIGGMLFHIVLDHHGPAAEARGGLPRRARTLGTALAVASVLLLGFFEGDPTWARPLLAVALGAIYLLAPGFRHSHAHR